MTLKIKYIKQAPEEIEKEAVENLIRNFNTIAINKGIKYRICFKSGYPHLILKNWLFENYSHQICYLGNYFKFVGDIDESILNEIKEILEEIDEEILVEVIKDERI